MRLGYPKRRGDDPTAPQTPPSKRKALEGLPPTWREDFMSAATGKYADAPLASALTGARPGEVVKRITAWVQHDEALGIETLCLYVQGHQGRRPNRATLPL